MTCFVNSRSTVFLAYTMYFASHKNFYTMGRSDHPKFCSFNSFFFLGDQFICLTMVIKTVDQSFSLADYYRIRCNYSATNN